MMLRNSVNNSSATQHQPSDADDDDEDDAKGNMSETECEPLAALLRHYLLLRTLQK
jgi:hypothetical protein